MEVIGRETADTTVFDIDGKLRVPNSQCADQCAETRFVTNKYKFIHAIFLVDIADDIVCITHRHEGVAEHQFLFIF